MRQTGGAFYDRQEVRNPLEREASIFQALPGLLRHAVDNCSFFRQQLAGTDPATVDSRAALSRLPILRKSTLLAYQRKDMPFGGMVATPLARLTHIFASPGPIFDPGGGRADYWRFARAMFAAGFRGGDLVHNTFSYHLTPAGQMVEAGARSLGCPVVPAGTGQTDIQLDVIAHLRPAAYTGTPSFLGILLDRAEEKGSPITSIEKALVGGEGFPKALQERFASRGIDVRQCYATADVGLIGYETVVGGGFVLDESVIVELVRPGTGDPVDGDEIGEVVITVFNPDYPLIRFATGDLSRRLEGESSCGRTNMRLAGWLGRADQTAKVRGMFVRPEQVARLVSEFPAVERARLVIANSSGQDTLLLNCETRERDAAGLPRKLQDAARSLLGLRAEIALVPPGSLARDGKVIEDTRPID